MPRGAVARGSPRSSAAGRPAATTRHARAGRQGGRPHRREAGRRGGRRRHADRLGPGGPRRPGGADQAAQQGVPGAVPERHDQARRALVRGPQQDAQARRLRPQRARRRAGQPGPPGRWARWSRAGCCGRSTLRRGVRLGATATPSCCSTSTASRPTATTFGDGNLYGLSQMGEIVGVFYNKSKVSEPPATLEEFEASLAGGQGRGRHPDPVRQPRRVAGHPRVRDRARADRRQGAGARLRLRPRGRVVRHARVPGAAEKIQEWADDGLLHARLQRHRLRPGVAAVRQGQGPVPDRRHVAGRRPRRSRWATTSASC